MTGKSSRNEPTRAISVSLDDSDIASFDLLRAVTYPDSDEADNPLGNGPDGVIEMKGQLQNVHLFDYDQFGRLLLDRATVVAAGVPWQ